MLTPRTIFCKSWFQARRAFDVRFSAKINSTFFNRFTLKSVRFDESFKIILLTLEIQNGKRLLLADKT
jgi:hypothetical protein